jgi:hypothetical protein
MTATAGQSATAAAQSLPKTVFEDVRHGVGDVLHMYTFPFRMQGRDVIWLGAIAAATGLAMPADDELDIWLRDHPETLVGKVLDPFRVNRSAHLESLGSGPVLLGLSGGLYVIGLIAGSEDLRDAGIGCAAAEHGQTILRWVLYKSVERRRPTVAGGDQFRFGVPGGDWYGRSFYGGHAANVMSCVSFLNHRFELSVVEPVLMVLALGVGMGRVADRAHWLSDTVLGAAVGYVMGRSVAHRQRAREREAETTDGRTDGGNFFATHDGERILVGWRRHF